MNKTPVRVRDLRAGDRLSTGRGIGVVTSLMRGEGVTSFAVRTNEGRYILSMWNDEWVPQVTD